MEATATAITSLKTIVSKFRHSEEVDKALGSMNTAWLRQQKTDEREGKPPSLGKFDRNREDLSENEVNFAFDWLKDDSAADAALTAAKPPFNVVNSSNGDVARLTREKKLLIDGLNAEKSAKETALKTVADLENNTKLLRGEIASLNSQIERADKSAATGLSSQTAILQNQIASLEDKLAKAEAKLDAATEGERKRADAAKTAHDAELDDEKRARIDAMEAYEKQITNEREDAATVLSNYVTNWNAERTQLEAKNAAIAATLAAITAKRKWREWLPKSLYDVVNVTSNLFALAGFILLFKWVGILAFIITACTFYAIVQDAKKTAGGWLTFFGVAGAFVIEAYYSYSHLNLFQKLLAGEKYPFGISPDDIGLAFTVLISGGSIYAVIMTALRSIAAAEAQRIAEIDAELKRKQNPQ